MCFLCTSDVVHYSVYMSMYDLSFTNGDFNYRFIVEKDLILVKYLIVYEKEMCCDCQTHDSPEL